MSFRRTYKTEGGHKRGHSNMCHYEHTEIIKAEAKKIRRANGRAEILDQLEDDDRDG